MKAVISTTYDDKYLYFLPLVTFLWNKLGVDVICFLPVERNDKDYAKIKLAMEYCNDYKLSVYQFSAPEHKEATYSQCSRLYGACLDLPEDEILVISDCDMAVFIKPINYEGSMIIWGADLVPEGQFPMCYAHASVKYWRRLFNLEGKTYQQCLDELLAEIECENMRGNYWGKDQQTLWEKTNGKALLLNRAKEGTQFATKRVDRDDINWRSYVNDDLVDAHLWRDGFEENNFKNIMELLQMKYSNDNFDWLISYTEAYRNLL